MFKVFLLIIFFMGMTFALTARVTNKQFSDVKISDVKIDLDASSYKPSLHKTFIAPINAAKNSLFSKERQPQQIHLKLKNAAEQLNRDFDLFSRHQTYPRKIGLSSHNFTNADFSHQSRLKENFAASQLRNARFASTLLKGASFEGASAHYALFVDAQMAQVNLNAVDFQYADFSGAYLRKACARGGNFQSARFTNADLSFTRFSGANLNQGKFQHAYIAGAFFVGTQMQNADFTGADLTGARFDRANLSGARFTDARIKGADFTGARLDGADFSRAIGAAPNQFTLACANFPADLPQQVDLPEQAELPQNEPLAPCP